MRVESVALLTAFFLAGCSGAGADPDDQEEGELGIEIPELDATKTTGVIRVLVVDDGIRPLAGVEVSVRGPGETLTQVTGDNGFAGFENVAPGSYFIEATRGGYTDAQTSVEVVAAVDDPPITRVLLTAIGGEAPFYREATIEGFMECGAYSPVVSANLCFIANYYPCFVVSTAGQPCTNLTADNSYFTLGWILDLQRTPDWFQAEMAWESTQAVSPEMILRVDVIEPASGDITADRDAGGVSPVMVSMDAAYLADEGVGTTHSLALESFTGGDAFGLTVEQDIRYYVHSFYGYTPPEGWLFSTESQVPPPPY